MSLEPESIEILEGFTPWVGPDVNPVVDDKTKVQQPLPKPPGVISTTPVQIQMRNGDVIDSTGGNTRWTWTTTMVPKDDNPNLLEPLADYWYDVVAYKLI